MRRSRALASSLNLDCSPEVEPCRGSSDTAPIDLSLVWGKRTGPGTGARGCATQLQTGCARYRQPCGGLRRGAVSRAGSIEAGSTASRCMDHRWAPVAATPSAPCPPRPPPASHAHRGPPAPVGFVAAAPGHRAQGAVLRIGDLHRRPHEQHDASSKPRCPSIPAPGPLSQCRRDGRSPQAPLGLVRPADWADLFLVGRCSTVSQSQHVGPGGVATGAAATRCPQSAAYPRGPPPARPPYPARR